MAANTLSDYAENAILNEWFGATAFSPSGTLYFGLSTTTIGAGGVGGINEPTHASYARASADNDKTTWSTSTTGGLSNDIAITFPQASAAWGTVTYGFIADHATSGNLYAYGALGTSKSIENGDTAQFAVGTIIITLD